jgi:hypothetical protein
MRELNPCLKDKAPDGSTWPWPTIHALKDDSCNANLQRQFGTREDAKLINIMEIGGLFVATCTYHLKPHSHNQHRNRVIIECWNVRN